MGLEAHMLTVALSVPRPDHVNYSSCADHVDRLKCFGQLSHMAQLDHADHLAGFKILAYCISST